MSNFNYGGQSFETMDYNVASSPTRRSYTEGPRTFKSRAEEEINSLDEHDYKHLFITVYSESGFAFHTGETARACRLSLAGQDYLYSPSVRKIIFCNAMALYCRKTDGYRQLWQTGRFVPECRPLFLNKRKLEETLLTVFKRISLSLGLLTERGIPAIAWQARTEKGIFYILWHNGAIVEETESITFAEKSFQDVRRTYKVMRFAPCNDGKDIYRVISV